MERWFSKMVLCRTATDMLKCKCLGSPQPNTLTNGSFVGGGTCVPATLLGDPMPSQVRVLLTQHLYLNWQCTIPT